MHLYMYSDTHSEHGITLLWSVLAAMVTSSVDWSHYRDEEPLTEQHKHSHV